MSEARETFSPAVVMPTFENARTLAGVVRKVTRLGLHAFVVNDGSTDETANVAVALARDDGRVSVITHPQNHGKAAALMSGFAAAESAGYTHAVTIDTDGQLDPDEIPRLLEVARREPKTLVLGTRDSTAADYPRKSRFGRWSANTLIRWQTGLQVSDSQCGLRVYPLAMVRELRCRGTRYGFETEVITRATWAGWGVREVPVSCTYLPAGERVSHFRPWIDTFRAVPMHARLTSRAILRWFSPARAWREVRNDHRGANEFARGLAVGVFIANLPVYGVQTVLSLYVARRLRLHPLSVVAGSHLSTPPIGPVLIALAIGVGHFLLHGEWIRLPRWEATLGGWLQLAGRVIVEWSLGALIVGTVLAVATYVVSQALLRYVATAPAAASASTD